MSMTITPGTEAIVAAKTDDDLLAMIAHPSDWQPQLLIAAIVEMKRRGIACDAAMPTCGVCGKELTEANIAWGTSMYSICSANPPLPAELVGLSNKALRTIAIWQRVSIIVVVVGVAAVALRSPILGGVYLTVGIPFQIVTASVLAKALKSSPILWGGGIFLSLLPGTFIIGGFGLVVGPVTLLVLILKAFRTLKAYCVPVGMFGARFTDIAD